MRTASSLVAVLLVTGYGALDAGTADANIFTGPRTTVFIGDITSTTNAQIQDDPPGDPNGTAADPSAVVADSHGNLIFADSDGAIVLDQQSASNPGYPIDPLYVWVQGETRILVGGGSDSLATAGTPALSTDAGTPSAVALDSAGNVFFADSSDGVVGVLAVGATEPTDLHVGGTWQAGNVYLLAGDPSGVAPTATGSVATSTSLNDPEGLLVDPNENVLIADSSVVEEIAENTSIPYKSTSAVVGDLYVIAGGGGAAPTAAGSSATSTQLGATGIAAGASGDLLVADANDGEVLDLAASTTARYGIASPVVGDVYVIAGDGSTVPSGTGVAAAAASIDPEAVTVGAAGNVVIADPANGAVEMLAESASAQYGLSGASVGDIYEIAGGGLLPEVTGTAMTEAAMAPSEVSIDSYGNILAVDESAEQIQLLCTAQCTGYTVRDAGLNPFTSPTTDDAYVIEGSTPTFPQVYNVQPQFDWQSGTGQLVDDNDGNLIVADPGHHAVDMIWLSHTETSGYQLSSPHNSTTYLLAGAESNDLPLSTAGSPANETELPDPTGVAVDAAGNVLIADDAADELAVLAEGASPAYGISGGNWAPGNIYLLAGGGTTSPGSVGVNATDTLLNAPGELAVDPSGNVVFTEAGSNAVDVVAESGTASFGMAQGAWHTGDVYRIAGDPSGSAPSAAGSSGSTAQLSGVQSIAVDASGNVLVGENFEVDVVAESTSPAYGIAPSSWHEGSIYVLAGNDSSGPPNASADGTDPLSTPLDPTGLAVDGDGNVVIADALNFSIDVLAENPTVVGYGIAGWAPQTIYMVAGSPGGASFPWAFTTPADTSWIPAGIVADPIYGLMITDAATGDLETYQSDPSSARGLTGIPGQGSASLSWTPPTMQSTGSPSIAPTYAVEVYDTGSNTPINSVNAGTADSTTVGGLSAGSSYQFTVVTSNPVGESQPSAKSASVLIPGSSPTTTTVPVPTTTPPTSVPTPTTVAPVTPTTTPSVPGNVPTTTVAPSSRPSLVSDTKANVALTISAPSSVVEGGKISYTLDLKPAKAGVALTGTVTATTRITKKVKGKTEITTLVLGRTSVKTAKVSLALATKELSVGRHTITLTYGGNAKLRGFSRNEVITVSVAGRK
jgi:hypothetical protein